MLKPNWKMWLLSFISLLTLVSTVQSLAVMSVDLGTEYMKIAVVSPGVPMAIALNKESKRKTAVAVALRDNERTFGNDALAVGVKTPQKCYNYLLDLVGKPFEHPSVKLYQKQFPYYNLEADPERGTVLFRHDSETTYSPEELLGMILSHAKSIAEEYTGQKPIRDVVLTVPVYFNQAERRALSKAAELAGLNLLQLISEPMAIALNYGMFRRKEINGTAKYLMFYDMGAYDTTVSIVGYSVVKSKDRGFTETHPQAQILGVSYDRTLGGLDLRVKIREYLADKFNELKKPKTDVRKNNRAMGKLFKEAEKVKIVLSANKNCFAQIENVMDDIDFKLEVTRDTLLELNADFFKRVIGPVEKAIQSWGGTLEEISEVILAGAGTRVPRVQEILNEFIGSDRELGKNLNTDEAATMGAVYKAADLSSGFKVKKFITKDAVAFPIDVEFERKYEDDAGQAATRTVKKNLYPPMNAFPQKKIMTFNKFTENFDFDVYYNQLDYLGQTESQAVGEPHLFHYTVKGVAEALDKHKDDPQIESKGVKAHFNLDDNGLLQVSSLESVFEKTITVEEQQKAEAERLAKEEATEKAKNETETDDEKKDDSWAKLGDTISSYFGAEKEETGSDEEKSDKKEDEKEDDGGEKKNKNAKDNDKKEKKKKTEKKLKEEKKKKEFKPIVETIKEPLEFEFEIMGLKEMTGDQAKASAQKLVDLDARDEAKKAQEMALNNLESQVIDMKVKLYEDIYEKSTTEEEREKILAKCQELSDWIDEEATVDTEVDVLEGKLKELTDLTVSLHARVKQHKERPEALEAMNNMVNSSQHFLGKAKNSTGVVDGYFTQEELDKLEKKINEIIEWRDQALKDQEAQPHYEMPKMTTSLIAEKALDLDREVKFLFNKAKIGKAEKDAKKKAEESKKAKAKAKKAKGNSTETIDDATTEGSEESTEKPENVDQTENPESTEESTEIPVTADENIPVNSDDSTASEEDTKTSEKQEESGDEDLKAKETIDDVFEDSTESTPHSEL